MPLPVILFIFFLVSPVQAQVTTPSLQIVFLQISGHALKVEVANTNALRRQGLMNRRMLSKDSGMLFVFPRAGQYSMWMKDTYIPLSVAFIDEQGVILNIEKMKPLTKTAHYSAGQAKYALEMNAGWFAERNIVTGDQMQGL